MGILSPGVYVTEVDASAIVPNVSNSVAFFAGNFDKGTIEQPFLVTTKADLETYFGKPTDRNFNEWYQCSKFLDYGNQLVISRAFTEGVLSTSTATIQTDSNVDGTLDTESDIKVTNRIGIYKGSVLTFGAATSDQYEVTAISTVNVNEIDLTIKSLGSNTGGLLSVGMEVGILQKHQNSEIEVEIQNGTATSINDYVYDLIKNETDFEFIKSTLPFHGQDAKVKFYGKTAEAVDLDIAVINSAQFNDIGVNPSQAEAFEGLSINNFFQYPPVGDDVGIVIRNPSTGLVESFVCSFDQAAVDGNNRSKYIETVINENSTLAYAVENLVHDDTPVADRLYKLSDGTQGSIAVTSGGNSPTVDPIGDIKNAYDEVLNKELFELDIIIGNELNPNAAISLADSRADCIAFIGANYGDVVGKKSAVVTDNLVKYIKSNVLTRSMFGSFFGNYHRIYDNFNKKYRWINCAGDMAGLRADTNSNLASWWASAGLKRGAVRNITSLGFSPDEAQRDDLYKNSINPVVSFPGEGNLVWGQKTLLNYASASTI